MNYMHYKVEIAFDRMEEAILEAQEHATPEGKLLYGRLMDELVGIRDRARHDLLDLNRKKAAPAVGTTEAAKKNISDSIIDDILDDVKNRRFTIKKVNRTCTDLCVILHTDSESERDHITKYLFDIFEKIIEIYNLGKQDDRKEADA